MGYKAFGCTRRIKLQRIQGATDIHVSDTKCYWHIKDALRKRKHQMKDPKTWETIKAMLDDVSNLGIPVLKEKLQEFMVAEMTKIEKVWTKEYFLKEGYDKKKYSYSDRPSSHTPAPTPQLPCCSSHTVALMQLPCCTAVYPLHALQCTLCMHCMPHPCTTMLLHCCTTYALLYPAHTLLNPHRPPGIP
jgi:hypothetical protein